MLYALIDRRSPYRWYELTIRSLRPFSNYFVTGSKRFKRYKATPLIPVNLPL